MKECGLGTPGRWSGQAARGIAVLGVGATVVLGLWSCSETEEPLTWPSSTRPGLGAAADTFVADTLVIADTTYNPTVLTGGGIYLLVGRERREDPFPGELDGRSYLRWNVSELPEGEITAARIDLIVRDVSSNVGADPESLLVELSAVTEAWDEDSLGVLPFPAPGAPIDTGLVRTAGVSDSTDVLVPNVFAGPNLCDLVASWRSDVAANLGVVIGPAPDETQSGFLRLISSEGTPRSTLVDVSTPLLTLTIAVADSDTTISLEAEQDGFVVSAHLPGSSDRIATPDSLLLLSAGYVQGLLFAFDLPALMASDPERFPAGLHVHQATLHLAPVRGTDWSLAAGDSVTLWAYQTSTVWSESEVPASIMLDETLSSAKVFEDDEVVLNVRTAVQRMVEGAGVSLVLSCSSATSQFRSLLCKSRQATQGRPELRIIFTRPIGGRLGDAGGGQS